MEASRLPDEHRDAAAAVRAVVDALASVVHAERATLELVVVALVAEGHVLIEDVPGVGKTLVARTLARAVDRVVYLATADSASSSSDMIAACVPLPLPGGPNRTVIT